MIRTAQLEASWASAQALIARFHEPAHQRIGALDQFASLSNLKSVHIGLFWERIRGQYPNVSEQAALASTFETFGGTREFANPSFRFEALLTPPLPRYWFEHPDRPDLLQLQQDRIIRNWRQDQESSRIYPRYEAVRDSFKDEVLDFKSGLRPRD